MNNIVWMVFDSCRYDALVAADTPNIDRLGAVEKRFSYASWTSPSHYVYLMGLMPHKSPRHVFASEIYKEEYSRWRERVGSRELSFKSFVPHLSLPRRLRALGYRSIGRVSLPVLNQFTSIGLDFDDYRLMDSHADFRAMVEGVELFADDLRFYFLNIGETHYPYMLEDELPHLSGVHGVVGKMDEGGGGSPSEPFDGEMLQRLRAQQVKCVEYLDELVGELFGKCPANTHFIVTSDHGELFGEDGYFGHGPIFHEKVFEVPFVEGRLQ